MTHSRLVTTLGLAILGWGISSTAQENGDAAAQANNPLANMTAFNLQDYYIGELTESDDDANQLSDGSCGPFRNHCETS